MSSSTISARRLSQNLVGVMNNCEEYTRRLRAAWQWTPGKFMLADTSPVYEHPHKASAIIAYVPQGVHESVANGIGDWLLIRLPDGKVGFIPNDAVKPK